MTGRDDTIVSRSETTEVKESHSSGTIGGTETHTHTEHREVHQEVPVRPAPEVTETTTTTTTIIED
ncbi:hypothetical protein GCM10008955_17780 [Deinococcus malanensis]|uniref:DUF2382 domain-containing protein n=1 Tax=Deinococcus malanensis TaxID=1706855 RepID=A0ABQ2EST6_9DEIO|nr:hypothetical protein [Deinococcus malanensis]GGK24618.1 hypothetical protein GCM10008955_17780 [Deinococcus malanensis]